MELMGCDQEQAPAMAEHRTAVVHHRCRRPPASLATTTTTTEITTEATTAIKDLVNK
jgi:hypothetical protein